MKQHVLERVRHLNALLVEREPMSSAPAPGLRPMRLARLVERAVSSMSIDLSGLRVLTEAATGADAVTPVIAALAGAVYVDAVTRLTRFRSVDQARDETIELADLLGVSDRIHALEVEELPGLVRRADVVTNSGHLRPIDAALIGLMKPSCVVPLEFETWDIDLRRKDVDLDVLRSRCIWHTGTNQRHPAVDTFSYLGTMAVRLLGDAGIAVYGSRLLVLCDNPFAPYLGRGLKSAGADLSITDRFDPGLLDPRPGRGGRGAQTPGSGSPRPRTARCTTRQGPWRGRRSILGRCGENRRRGARHPDGAARSSGSGSYGRVAVGGRAGTDCPPPGRWFEGGKRVAKGGLRTIGRGTRVPR